MQYADEKAIDRLSRADVVSFLGALSITHGTKTRKERPRSNRRGPRYQHVASFVGADGAYPLKGKKAGAYQGHHSCRIR